MRRGSQEYGTYGNYGTRTYNTPISDVNCFRDYFEDGGVADSWLGKLISTRRATLTFTIMESASLFFTILALVSANFKFVEMPGKLPMQIQMYIGLLRSSFTGSCLVKKSPSLIDDLPKGYGPIVRFVEERCSDMKSQFNNYTPLRAMHRYCSQVTPTDYSVYTDHKNHFCDIQNKFLLAEIPISGCLVMSAFIHVISILDLIHSSRRKVVMYERTMPKLVRNWQIGFSSLGLFAHANWTIMSFSQNVTKGNVLNMSGVPYLGWVVVLLNFLFSIYIELIRPHVWLHIHSNEDINRFRLYVEERVLHELAK